MHRFKISLFILFGFLFCFNATSFAASGTATSVGTDTTTQGNWMGTYGTIGYYIPNGPSLPPSDGSTFSPGAAQVFTWGTNVGGTGALKTSGGNIASCWFNNLGTSAASLTLVPSGSQTVALYLLDYDLKGRSESVSVSDASNAPLIEPTAVSGANFGSGEYLLYTITGEVHIKITLVNGPNAVASGIFFGQSSTMPPPVAAGAYITHIIGIASDDSPAEADLTVPAGSYLVHARIAFVHGGTTVYSSNCQIFYATPNHDIQFVDNVAAISPPPINLAGIGPATFWETVLDATVTLTTSSVLHSACGVLAGPSFNIVFTALAIPSVVKQ